MTEPEWLTCTNPHPMLAFLRAHSTERRAKLFACACCRTAWNLLDDEARKAIRRLETFVEGEASEFDQLVARAEWLGNSAWDVTSWRFPLLSQTEQHVMRAIHATLFSSLPDVLDCCTEVGSALRDTSSGAERSAATWTTLIREVFGNPFRQIAAESVWLTWNDRTVARIAKAIYDERAFSRMPILADALEDAGCDDANILNHCRGPGPHVRGCWVVDLILGKQ
jgi:hypothetical protein